MIRWLTLLAVLQISISPASAETATMRGAGALDCSDWTAARADPASNIAAIHVSWMMGFLSGFSHFEGKSLLKNTNQDAVSTYVDNQCKLKPTAKIFDIAIGLGEELAK